MVKLVKEFIKKSDTLLCFVDFIHSLFLCIKVAKRNIYLTKKNINYCGGEKVALLKIGKIPNLRVT